MIEDNRITFFGGKVAYGFGSKVGAFLMSRDVASTGISVTFAAVAAELAMPGGSAALQVAVTTLKWNMVSLGVVRLYEMFLLEAAPFLPEDAAKKFVINTKPDPHLPSNLDQWGTPAFLLRAVYGAYGGMAAAATVFGVRILGVSNGVLPIWEGGCRIAPAIMRLVSGFRRWNNVWNGKWRVEDRGPPPEPVRKPVQDLNPTAASAAARVAHAPV